MSELPLKKISNEVFMATDPIIRLDRRAVEFIKKMSAASPKKRSRICSHQDPSDLLHEMIIAIQSDSYVRPHRHHNKVESFHLVEGEADIVILDDKGSIVDLIKLGLNNNFYYRLNTPHYHTLIIRSPVLVIHEITNGPFNAAASDYAAFSPDDQLVSESQKYMEELKKRVALYEQRT